ncbi:M56 family metallopeptidase [Mucilaginibacter auburnensis]|uniref:Beta-lactamase regulating signal transducer with metallopeptidase domain n=1 Tax=Mucilaginibacter auburnensis TaxID=1457233 RepID=A0A2H9VNC3_9SPHI|nr:M56 family metallopeptidase [Mucilaginibacter auburnensis]PJJ79826.1 beta-lactamase regulating signal transducer with metallopeptidase domain [Mucilaginibacter auburnensis]
MSNLISSLFTDQLIAALCNTLLYSFIYGLLLAALAGIVIMLTRHAAAVTRYNLLAAAFMMFTLAIAVTFVVQFNNGLEKIPVTAQSNYTTLTAPANVGQATQASMPESASSHNQAFFENFITTHRISIVLIWFIIICVRCVQLGWGLMAVHRLKHKKIHQVANHWVQKTREMAGRLGVTQQVNILESELAKVPMVLGHFKPVILIPIGLLTALSTAEVEAVLLHELAHIRRRDYLVNLLQSMLEIIFFFNPAVLWVSHLIKTERENCCDDIAISKNVTKVNYINALVACEIFRSSKPVYGMAMSGSGNQLIKRVHRMVKKRNNGLNTLEMTVLIVCLVISGIGFSAYAGKDRIKEAALAIAKVVMPAEGEVPLNTQKESYKQTTAANVSDKSKLVIAQRKVIDSMVASAVKFTTRYADSAKTVALIETRQDSYNVINFKTVTNASDTDKLVKTTVNTQTTYTTAANQNGGFNRYQSLVRRDSMDRAYYDFSLDKNNNINDGLRHIPRTYNEQMALELVKDGIIPGDAASMRLFSYKLGSDEFIVNGKKQPDEVAKKYKVMFDRHTNNPKYAASMQMENSHILNRIILEMVKDGIIDKSDNALANLSLALSNEGFVVNGQKQPAAIFKKYFDAFVKTAPNGEMSWRYNMSSK